MSKQHYSPTKVELVPRLPKEIFSYVAQVTNTGIALVLSYRETANSGEITPYLYRKGHRTPLKIGLDTIDILAINGHGKVAGTTFRETSAYRGFRFDPTDARLSLLRPLPSEPDAWALAIHDNGDVLGYSFVDGGRERIGIWRGQTPRLFVEGTPKFPTISNWLLWNDRNLIVITDTDDLNSYLLPRPGRRLKLADLAPRLQTWTRVFGVNDNARAAPGTPRGPARPASRACPGLGSGDRSPRAGPPGASRG